MGVAIAVAGTGCDAGSRAADAAVTAFDARQLPDAASVGQDASWCAAWDLVRVTPAEIELIETFPVQVGRSARFTVRYAQCAGSLRGELSVSRAFEARQMFVEALSWQRPSCLADPPEMVERPLIIEFPSPGSWTLETTTGPVMIDVQPASTVATARCSAAPGLPTCTLDDDCATGEICIWHAGAGCLESHCQRPCELDRDCLGTGRCGTSPAGITNVCVDGVECAPGRPCPGGFDCDAGGCVAAFQLSQASRHSCTCDDECDAPLRCLREGDVGRCEVRCPTGGDGWCGPMHSCGTASIESDGTCGWIGD